MSDNAEGQLQDFIALRPRNMCTDNEIAEAAASLRYLEPPQAIDLEPATFVIPVSDAEVAERPLRKANWSNMEGMSWFITFLLDHG